MIVLTGGCQCGAVRFRTELQPERTSICHCRMCQKAFGNFFAPLATVVPGTLVWTKREPKRFQSSNYVARGFCGDCGTPLTYEAPDGVALAVGAFDDPASVIPTIQFGTEAMLPYFGGLASLPSRSSEADALDNPFLSDIKSHQHPDRPDADEKPAS